MRSFTGTDNYLPDKSQYLWVLQWSWQKTQVFILKYYNRLRTGILGTSLCFWQTDVLVPTMDRRFIVLELNLFGKFYGVQHISNTFTNEVRVIPRNRRQKTYPIFPSSRNISNSALSLMGAEEKVKEISTYTNTASKIPKSTQGSLAPWLRTRISLLRLASSYLGSEKS